MKSKDWNGQSYGGSWGTALICLLARWGGRDLCYLGLIPVVLWFWCADARARRACCQFWQTLYPNRCYAWAWWHVPRHFWIFSRGLVDRVLDVVAPRSLDFSSQGEEYIHKALEEGRGCILLSAHLGSFELAARWLSRQRVGPLPRIHVVMLDAEDPRVQRQLARSMGSQPYGLIDLKDPQTAALEIIAALGKGEICCLLGDRHRGGATLSACFLGRPMLFPTGPFLAAASSGAPIVPTFCTRVGWSKWLCQADPPWHIHLGKRRQRKSQLQQIINSWAQRIERAVRANPWSWNNYFDVWKDAEAHHIKE